MTLASYMLLGAGRVASVSEARELLAETVRSGAALAKLAEFVEAQGGDKRYVYEPDRFPKASLTFEVKAPTDGFISAMNTEEIGLTSLVLGGGRETKESKIDLTVGIVFEKKIGAKVNAGDTIAVLHANDKEKLSAATERLQKAITVGQTPISPVPHILGVVEQS